ncbi:MAG: hypothetical protein K2X27_12415 [Candidatus Obscuribacterales bacterium]|nr:hypothetical protein [Candidatus Obscuribacterales bacterium]
MRFLGISILSFSLAFLGVGVLAADLDLEGSQILGKLEKKYFGHLFEQDDENARVSRIEELVFGSKAEGSIKERLEKINQLLPKEEAQEQSPDQQAPVPRKIRSTKRMLNSFNPPSELPDAPSKRSLAEEESFELGNDVRVDGLEKSIVGISHKGETLSARICRMENVAFGGPSNQMDFNRRLKALDMFLINRNQSQAAEEEESERLRKAQEAEDLKQASSQAASVAGAPSSLPSAGTRPGAVVPQKPPEAASAPTQYPHLDYLEKNILGELHNNENINIRIKRLEIIALGSASGSEDLTERIAVLDAYVEKLLRKRGFNDGPVNQSAQNSVSSSKQKLATIGNTLLTVSGLGGFAALGGLGPRMQGAARQPAAPVEMAASDPSEQDPVAYSPVPPAAGARLISKVGWCEVQLYGHTFSAQHLPDRLRQLSSELQIGTNKSGVQLMDDIGPMIRAVQIRRPARPIGVSPQGPANF